MQKYTYIVEKVKEFARQLLPMGISHITIYITGSRELFSPALPIQRIPFKNGELLVQEMKNLLTLPISVILKENTF